MEYEYMVKCDICGKIVPQSQTIMEYDEHGSLITICRDCIIKKLNKQYEVNED